MKKALSNVLYAIEKHNGDSSSSSELQIDMDSNASPKQTPALQSFSGSNIARKRMIPVRPRKPNRKMLKSANNAENDSIVTSKYT